ncbi:MAG TPA: EAL domain-containing protein [Noviherbaspirillum sp.]
MHHPNANCPIQQRFGSLLDAAPDAMMIVDAKGTIRLVNSHAERVFGCSRMQLTGNSVDVLVPERYRSGHGAHRERFSTYPMSRPMGGGRSRLYGRRADGNEFPVDISLNPVTLDGEKMTVVAIRDMSARQREEDKLRDLSLELEHSRAELQTVLDSLSEGVVVFSPDGELLNANPAALRMHGVESLADAPRHLQDFAREFDVSTLDGDPLPVDQWPLARIARGETVSAVELSVWRHGTGEHWIGSYSGAPVVDPHTGQRMLAVCTVVDVTERKHAEERIRQAGLHDPLTGLPNRALLFEYSRHVLAHAQRNRRNAAVLFIDLDRFKPINDTHGHEVGDAVLQTVAGRLLQCIRQSDFAFRLGGDEFLIILPDIRDGAYAGEVARHVAHAINQPIHVDAREMWLSTSIGISIFPRDAQDIDTLINQADTAMYHAKHSGRNRYQFYSAALDERVSTQARIEHQLKETLLHGGFRLLYQPVVDMHTLRLTGVEALLRWSHEGIGPDRFVPIAEVTGLIGQVGQWVIAEACRQHNLWIAHGLPAIPIAINVSAAQFRQTDVVEQFARAIETHRIRADALQIELTETALMEDIDRAVEQLAQVRSLGVKISLDDFGTGYSSLSYLSRLPIDKLKVDKSFVYRLESDAASRNITNAIIALGHTLQLEIVAEGIESATVLQYLRKHGCNHAQGYHVCAPVPAEDFEAWYRNRDIVSA